MACRLDGTKPLSETMQKILLNGRLGTNFSETLIEVHTFSFKKMHLKISGKWPRCASIRLKSIQCLTIARQDTIVSWTLLCFRRCPLKFSLPCRGPGGGNYGCYKKCIFFTWHHNTYAKCVLYIKWLSHNMVEWRHTVSWIQVNIG